MLYTSFLIYEYPRAKFSSLKLDEASQCLQELVPAIYIHVVLNELRDVGYSHNDVRLPNICFTSEYKAVLIDLDRCFDVNKLAPYFMHQS